MRELVRAVLWAMIMGGTGGVAHAEAQLPVAGLCTWVGYMTLPVAGLCLPAGQAGQIAQRGQGQATVRGRPPQAQLAVVPKAR